MFYKNFVLSVLSKYGSL